MTTSSAINSKKQSSESVLNLLSEVQVSRGLLTKSIGCSGCSDRVEVSYKGLNGDPDSYEVWEVLSEIQVLCMRCAAKFSEDPIQGNVVELSRVSFQDEFGEDQTAWVAPETASQIVRKVCEMQEDGLDVRSPMVEHGAATRVRHFANWKALRGA